MSAIGDVDRSVTVATQHCAEAEERLREKTIVKLKELVGQHISLEALGPEGYDPLALTKTYRTMRVITKPTLADDHQKKTWIKIAKCL